MIPVLCIYSVRTLLSSRVSIFQPFVTSENVHKFLFLLGFQSLFPFGFLKSLSPISFPSSLISDFSQFPLCFVLSRFSHVWLFAILWTVVCQAPLSMGFSRQEYWSGLPCLPPGDLPGPGIEPGLLHLLHWQEGSSQLAPPQKPSLSFAHPIFSGLRSRTFVYSGCTLFLELHGLWKISFRLTRGLSHRHQGLRVCQNSECRNLS